MTIVSSFTTSQIIPWTTIGACPDVYIRLTLSTQVNQFHGTTITACLLQHIQLKISCSLSIRLFIPKKIISMSPLQYIQLTNESSIRTNYYLLFIHCHTSLSSQFKAAEAHEYISHGQPLRRAHCNTTR
jgi:hypothetical protein